MTSTNLKPIKVGLLGMGTGAAKAAYIIIGIAALLALLSLAKLCPCQRSGSCAK